MGRVRSGKRLAVTGLLVLGLAAMLAPAALAKAKKFKVLEGFFDQSVEVFATHYFIEPCWEQQVSIVATSDYSLDAKKGVKTKLEPSVIEGAITLEGIQFSGSGENTLQEDLRQNGPNGEDCPPPDPVGGYDTSGCGPEQVSPPAKLELTESGSAPTTESFGFEREGLAPFGGFTDPDGATYTCHAGSQWQYVTFPAPSKKKRKALLKATKPVTVSGRASYSGPEGLTDCLCDRIEGYNVVETDWSLRLKPLG